jgi:predicted membrane-bound spermidine synthase
MYFRNGLDRFRRQPAPGVVEVPSSDRTSAPGSRPVLAVAGLLFLSGISALILQIGWMREFRLVFGASTAASAAVLAIFMGGLGLGNALLGRRADQHPSPLRFYAALEFVIALTGALSPYLIDGIRSVYIALGGQTELGLDGATGVRLLLSAAVLAAPTIAMGGTLPAAARAVTAVADRPRRSVGLLYGINTLGAVVGAAASTFLLLESLGTRRTLWLACAISFAVAIAAWAIARPRTKAAQTPAGTDEGEQTPPVGRGVARGGATLRPAEVYAAAAIVGFAFFLMELVWYRMLGPLLGGTTFTFGLILMVALAGIGAGGACYPLLFRRAPPRPGAFGLTCGLEAAFIALPFALGDRIAILAADLQHWNAASFPSAVLGWTLIAAIVVLPAAFVSGIQFPILVGLVGQGRHRVGRQVGLAFAWNTVGAIGGSLAGGFGLLPALTAPGTWRAVVVLLAALGGAVLLRSFRSERALGRRLLEIGTVGLSLALIQTTGPTAVWRHSAIGTGRAHLREMTPNSLREWMHRMRGRVIWEAEGVESSVALAAGNGLSFVVNGRSDGNAISDVSEFIMPGILGAILHPRPRRSFVVGLGTGETVGWLADVPSMERVDVVELEPTIEGVARWCAAGNRGALDNPKVRASYNDAREVLLTSPERYDLIVSEPSNPYRAGVASLFTREFYSAARERLTDDGLFLQWLQAYEVEPRTVATVLATLGSSFPYVEIWQTDAEDLLLVCANRPIDYSVPELRERIREGPIGLALRIAWLTTDLEGVLAHYVGGPSAVRLLAASEADRVNTDDRNRLEYSFARSVGRARGVSIAGLREVITTEHPPRPPVHGGEVDWGRVEDQRQSMQALGMDMTPPRGAGLTQDQVRRAIAQRRAISGDAQGSIAAWQSQPREPIHPIELASLAFAFANLGDTRAEPLVERHYAFDPIEAEATRAILLWRRGRLREASDALERVFIGLRGDPWPRFVNLAFQAAVEVARADPSTADRLYRALAEPFALYKLEEKRRLTAALVAAQVSAAAAAEAVEASEPYVPWTKSFLELRDWAYRTTGHPLAGRAERDLVEFSSREPGRAAVERPAVPR